VAVLIDTSFLLALTNHSDDNHQRALNTMRTLAEARMIAIPVLLELFYMVATRVSYSSAVKLFGRVQSAGFQLQPISREDMARMQAIMEQYEDSEFDFVDAAIMALAERLNITQICTFDHGDLTIFRPVYCDYLELLPYALNTEGAFTVLVVQHTGFMPASDDVSACAEMLLKSRLT
jgi:uncharacterized protein